MQLTDTLRVEPGGWTLVEQGWNIERAVATGSNFLCGNGYLGYRGTTAEQRAEEYVALVVSDSYDCADGKWRELTTAPNPLYIAARWGGTALSVGRADRVDTRFDLRAGMLDSSFSQTLDGVRFTVQVQRFASYDRLHLLAQRWSLTADADVQVQVDAGIDTHVWNLNGVHLPHIDVRTEPGGELTATGRTVESGVEVAVASTMSLQGAAVANDMPVNDAGVYGRRRTIGLTAGQPLVIEIAASVYSSQDTMTPAVEALAEVIASREQGFETAHAASAARWKAIWAHLDVAIEGDVVSQAALRFSVYHHRVCTPAHTDHLPIGARGLSCQAYQGSAFWDQEIYNLPAFLLTEPGVARSLLVYRYRTLDGARRKAARLGYEGAYYAWVSGTTGDELCPDVFFVDVLTGRPIRNHFNVWQMHISPDIVTTIQRYVEVTGDEGFLVQYGAEIAFEVARFLRSFVRYDDARGTWHCIRLLGPDEWHENVDDNAFTNYQAWAALDFAIRTHEELTRRFPLELADLSARVALREDELGAWRRIRDGLVLPAPDPASGLIEQFRGFFDLEDVGPEVVRSRLIDPGEYWGWPNGVAVATQVSKQADIPMLLWLHRRRFEIDVQAANYHYYADRCAHGSSLSHAAFGMLAVQIGEIEAAYTHFLQTATLDLLNTSHAVVGGTFIGGIHTAACAGTYQLAVFGFGGLDMAEDRLLVNPRLPQRWTSLTYPVTWRGHHLTIRATRGDVTVMADFRNATAAAIRVGGESFELAPGESVCRSLPA